MLQMYVFNQIVNQNNRTVDGRNLIVKVIEVMGACGRRIDDPGLEAHYRLVLFFSHIQLADYIYMSSTPRWYHIFTFSLGLGR